MKKTVVLSLALSTFSISSFSQSVVYGTDEKEYASIQATVPSSKTYSPLSVSDDGDVLSDVTRYKLSRIGDNWFLTAGIGNGTFLGTPKGCEDWFGRSKPVFNVSVGKWHSPFFGTRFVYQGVKLVDGNIHNTGFTSLLGDLMWNLSSYFHRSYFPSAANWNIAPFVGAGLFRNNDRKTNAFAVSYGINGSYAVSDRLAIVGEIGGTTTKQDWDGLGKSGHIGDNFFHASIGLGISIGKKGWRPKKLLRKSPDFYQHEDSYVKYPRNDYSGLNSLRSRLGISDSTTSVSFNTPVLFFFKINSTKFVDVSQMNNIREIAAAVKDNDLRLKIVGAADSHTGTPAINRRLAIRRCKYIAKLLIKEGVPKSKMTGASIGGVDIYKPYPANRHTCVIVYKD